MATTGGTPILVVTSRTVQQVMPAVNNNPAVRWSVTINNPDTHCPDWQPTISHENILFVVGKLILGTKINLNRTTRDWGVRDSTLAAIRWSQTEAASCVDAC